MVPGILVGVALVGVLIVGGAVAFMSGSGSDETVTQELETWSRCLRSEGAPVPLVEALRDGGFRITFDAAVLEGDGDMASVSTAFEACRDDAPDLVREFVDRLDMFGGFPPGGDFFGFDHGPFDGGGGPFGGMEPGDPYLDEVMLDELCWRVVDRVESGLPVPPRLRRACDVAS